MFLLRFSRKEPEKLTFSFKVVPPGTTNTGTAVCRHRRKPCGVSLSDFIYQHFHPRKFHPVSKRLVEDVANFASIEQYCESSGYFISGS
jgi:hypothetical protein